MENSAANLLLEKLSAEHEVRQSRGEIAVLKADLSAVEERLARATAQSISSCTGLKQIEEDLRTSRFDLEQLFNLSPVPMVIWRGPEHIYSLVNAAHDQMLGKSVVSKAIRKAHTQEEAPKIRSILDRVYQTGEAHISREVPYFIRGDDAKLRPIWVHEWFYPFRDPSGQVVGVLGVAQDVTEQVEGRLDAEASEFKYREAKEHLELALESGSMGTWELDLTTQHLTGSPAWRVIHGLKEIPKDLSLALDQTVYPEDREELSRIIFDCVKNQNPFEHQYRIVRPDGTMRWLEVKAKTYLGSAGNPAIMIGTATDVTEKKLLFLEVENSRLQLHNCFMQAPIAISVLEGPEHIFTLSNPLYDQLTKRNVLGKKVREAFVDAEAAPFFDMLDKVYQTGEPFFGKEASVPFIDARGQVRERFVDFSYHPLRDSQGKIYSVVARLIDVTERKQTEEALQAAKAEAERANKAKSRLLAAASHDLRQPLQAINLYFGVLANQRMPGSATIMKNIDKCLGSLGELLDDLLDLSKLDSDAIQPDIAEFPLAGLFKSVLAVHMPAAKAKGISLRAVPTKLWAKSDPILFERIVGNLVANAVRYTEKGGVIIGCRRRDGSLWVEVVDTGIGIPVEKHDEIFDEFHQLGNHERNRAKGTGLGLAIVKKTAALLGSEVRLTSRLGCGSTFALSVPKGAPASSQGGEENC